jgi:16S rRNA (adenine1518-N6/adenine1519-N6)-dimethyltransferase
VIRLQLREHPPCEVTDETLLFRLIHAAFGQRRKTIANSLCGAGYTKPQTAAAIAAAGISSTARAESLTMAQFAALTEAFAQLEKS